MNDLEVYSEKYLNDKEVIRRSVIGLGISKIFSQSIHLFIFLTFNMILLLPKFADFIWFKLIQEFYVLVAWG